ncbi:unnamed protein product [Miscanthus lutarioriparius]|uniref:Fringe-like glycosyltransferase domain-containing protein n=1 Tax=Miscanthus lutarioriparius TaxID=422564 RepID=A0A811P1A0_9POAL|nr:unnamed protein product [Miscanthus lutarioriparius]
MGGGRDYHHQPRHCVALSLFILVSATLAFPAYVACSPVPGGAAAAGGQYQWWRWQRSAGTSGNELTRTHVDDGARSSGVVAARTPTSLSHIVFGIGGAARTWGYRRGIVADSFAAIVNGTAGEDGGEVRWFVMGDDDTVFFPDNLVTVLRKYDHEEMYYVGAPSESVAQDAAHSVRHGVQLRRTFESLRKTAAGDGLFVFNTRPWRPDSACARPLTFFLSHVRNETAPAATVTEYTRHVVGKQPEKECDMPGFRSAAAVQTVRVLAPKMNPSDWHRVIDH